MKAILLTWFLISPTAHADAPTQSQQVVRETKGDQLPTQYRQVVRETKGDKLPAFNRAPAAAALPAVCQGSSLSANYPNDNDTQFCKRFSKQWVKELKLKRHPLELTAQMEQHLQRLDQDKKNIKCIEALANKSTALTEWELTEVRARNSQNMSNALKRGQEKGALLSEARDTTTRLFKEYKKQGKDKSKNDAVVGCLNHLDRRAGSMNDAYQELEPPPKPEPPAEPSRFRMYDAG